MSRLLGVLVSAALLCAACGGSSESTSTTDPGVDARGDATSTTSTDDGSVDAPAKAIDDDVTSDTVSTPSTEVITPDDPTRSTTTAGKDDLEPFGPFGETAVEFTAADGTTICSCVLLADDASKRAQGLMNVLDLNGYAGMLFTWPDDVQSQFTMRDTPMPLSIAWIAADGQIVSTLDMDPCLNSGTCPSYASSGAYRYALEVPQGRLGIVGVTEASTLRIVDTC